ncbi:ribosome maturation factor RimM [Microbacteriaceae bacterium VKM Ac-2855]|nr:ribosome maturation factor RimM [Microbacteriaceae bacterium VKM Ac-2855]
MSAPQPGTTQLRVARLTKAHGLKGAIKLELYTDEPEKRFTPGSIFTLQVPRDHDWAGKKLELAELRWYNGNPVAFFKGVDDRTAAEALLKAILWIDEEISTVDAGDDAWYDYQLVGLTVLRDGAKVGLVHRVDHFPAQDLLAVGTPNGEVLVPFVSAIVPNVDLKAGTLTVTPPLGLFEEIPDEDPAPAENDSAAETAESDAVPASEEVAEAKE